MWKTVNKFNKITLLHSSRFFSSFFQHSFYLGKVKPPNSLPLAPDSERRCSPGDLTGECSPLLNQRQSMIDHLHYCTGQEVSKGRITVTVELTSCKSWLTLFPFSFLPPPIPSVFHPSLPPFRLFSSSAHPPRLVQCVTFLCGSLIAW